MKAHIGVEGDACQEQISGSRTKKKKLLNIKSIQCVMLQFILSIQQASEMQPWLIYIC